MKTTTGAMKCWLAVGMLVAALLAAPAAADCSSCPKIGHLKCLQQPPAYTGARGFSPDQFKYSCLGDAGQDCTHKSNSEQPDDPNKSCCSCYLYAALSTKATSTLFTNKDIKSHKHVLVIPKLPCKGVESWNTPSCPKEAIWSYGFQELKNAGKQDTYGMAINPVERRGMHQMHVHLAEVNPTLRSAITNVDNSHHLTGYLDSSYGILPSGTPYDPSKHLKVNIVKQNDPASAKPFATVYGLDPKNTAPGTTPCKDAVCHSSTLVWQISPGKFAVVSNPTGPAESMLTGV